MCSKELLVVACWGLLLGGLRLTSTTTTTTFVAAMSISNPDLERYFRSTNISQPFTTMSEERIAMDLYTYAFLNYSYGENKNQFDEEKARYGEGKIATVHGKLVHISNANDLDDDSACSPNILGTRGTPTPPAGVQWIALVRRGRCTFEEKVKNVYEKGASGVIVYNDKIVMNLEKMQIKGKSRNITAVITYQEIGLDMALKVDEGNDVYCSIIEGRSGMRPINSLNRTSVLFVSISFIVLMVISLVWLIFYYIQRFRYLQTKDQQSRQLCSVTKKAIMKIPTKTGKSSDEKDLESDCCAICIEAYKTSDCIRVLPCKHEFHKNCIDPWLIEHRTCPMCKLDVLKFYGYVFLGSEESILEFEAERTAAARARSEASAAGANADPNRAHPLSDLIRGRDFVIDFPRIFVLEAGTNSNAMNTENFASRLPERSQSSLSLTYAKDWMSMMTNKLEEQRGGQPRMRKTSTRFQMQENLLGLRVESIRKRRSRSADGRYSNGFLGRMEFSKQQELQKDSTYSSSNKTETITNEIAVLRRNSDAIYDLTEASYAESKQRRQTLRRSSDIELGDVRDTWERRDERDGLGGSQPPDVNITIQINGEGVKLDE